MGRGALDGAAVRDAAFLRESEHPAPTELGWGSGFDLLRRSFAPLGPPLTVLDSFLAWLAVGLLLSLTRVLTGNIAVAIGLHAGWVVVLRMLQHGTVRGAAAPISIWVGQFDGLLGYWMVPWRAAIALALVADAQVVGALRLRGPVRRIDRLDASRSEPPQRIVELEIALFVGERNRKNFGEPVADPGGIVEPHVACRRTPRRVAAARCAAIRPAARDAAARPRRLRRQPVDLPEVQTVGLAAPLEDAKALPPDARQAEQAVRQLMEVDDLGHACRRRRVGIAAAPTSRPRGSARRRNPGLRAGSGAPCRRSASRRCAAAAGPSGNSTRLSGNSGIAFTASRASARRRAACRACRRIRRCS